VVVNDDHESILHRYGYTGLQKLWGYEFDLLGLRDVIGHVTIGLGICGFLLAVHINHASILHRYGDMGPQRYWGHDLDLLWSREVIGHVTIGLGVGSFLLVVNDDLAPILHGYGDTGLQRFWGHEFDLLGSRDVIGHMTLDSAYVVSYWWSIGTMHLSCTVTEILGPKDNGVTSLTFWGHVTSSVT